MARPHSRAAEAGDAVTLSWSHAKPDAPGWWLCQRPYGQGWGTLEAPSFTLTAHYLRRSSHEGLGYVLQGYWQEAGTETDPSLQWARIDESELPK